MPAPLDTDSPSGPPPVTRRRKVRASEAVLFMQEAAAQVQNDAYALLRDAHEARTRVPGKLTLQKLLKHSAAAKALGRAKQAQYAARDAAAMFASFRSNFFAWIKDRSSRPGEPRPPRFYRRGQRARLRFDYQEFEVDGVHLALPPLVNLGTVALRERDRSPILGPGDRLVEVRLEPARSRRYVFLDLVIRRAENPTPPPKPAGSLLVDLGVARLVTCLDDANLRSFFIDGGMAKSILTRGAKWTGKAQAERKAGARHGKRQVQAIAARSARQMEDLMKKVALLLVTYAVEHQLKRLVVGRNPDWKQFVDLGAQQNQIFTHIPHGKLLAALRTKCARAGIDFVETEESYTSKTDHVALELMGPKPDGYHWLGSRSSRGSFRSSVGLTLQADVNGCLGLGRKVGGEAWLRDLLQRLGTATGARLVPRRVQLSGYVPALLPGPGRAPSRAPAPRDWMPTKVALQRAGLLPDLEQRVAASDA